MSAQIDAIRERARQVLATTGLRMTVPAHGQVQRHHDGSAFVEVCLHLEPERAEAAGLPCEACRKPSGPYGWFRYDNRVLCEECRSAAMRAFLESIPAQLRYCQELYPDPEHGHAMACGKRLPCPEHPEAR